MSIKKSLGGIIADEIVCINLRNRKDRRTKFKREARKKNFPVTFANGVVNETNPQLGKWRAHIDVWKSFLKYKRGNNLVVFEDDSKLLVTRLMIPPPPSKWNMLYLGGNIQRAIADEETDKSIHWKRVCTLMTHAYIANKETVKELLDQSTEYFKSCKEGGVSVLPIDQWLCTQYHPNKNVYISIPDRVIQRDDYSDTRNQFITFNQQLTARANFNGETGNIADQIDADESQLTSIPSTPMEIVTSKDEEGNDCNNCVLKLPKILTEDLPNVTLITPTHNNHSGFYFVIRNFYKLEYPKEKLTWIIADDSEEGKEVRDLIPSNDPRIKYISCKMGKNSFLPISKKINLCMNYVTSQDEVIMHFFDDQYYLPLSVLSRVKVLLANRDSNVKCIGCTEFGVFDIVNNRSYQKYYPDANNNKTVMYGPSLCYNKSWWDARKFDEDRYVMETFYFTKGRLRECLQMPYSFVSISLVSNDPDVTEADRYGSKGNSKKDSNETFAKYNTDAKLDNFFDGWDKETQNFILLMKETIDDD